MKAGMEIVTGYKSQLENFMLRLTIVNIVKS